jgi:hypothetical protein
MFVLNVVKLLPRNRRRAVLKPIALIQKTQDRRQRQQKSRAALRGGRFRGHPA